MTAELAQQRAMLERELANLDALLAPDANWSELCAVEAEMAQVSGGIPVELDSRYRQLRATLSGNRIFCARGRIVEAIDLMRQELEHDRSASEIVDCSSPPCLASSGANETPKPELDQVAGSQPEPEPAGAISNERGDFLSRERAKVRVQSRVAIHLKPPGGNAPDRDIDFSVSNDLSVIRGISSEIALKLNALGVRGYRQIANWSASDVASVRAALGLGSRITRENWIEQAAMLEARGDCSVGRSAVKTEAAVSASPVVTTAVASSVVATAAAAIFATLTPDVTNGTGKTADVDGLVANHDEQNVWDGKSEDGVADAAVAILARINGSQLLDRDAMVVEQTPAKEANDNDVLIARPDEIIEETPVAMPAFTRGAVVRTGENLTLLVDPLIEIRGVDEAIVEQLIGAGVTRFSHIANWTVSDIARHSVELGLGQKITRQAWLEQAAILASGAATAFSEHAASGEAIRSGALIDWDASDWTAEVCVKDVPDNGSDVCAPDVAEHAIACCALVASADDVLSEELVPGYLDFDSEFLVDPESGDWDADDVIGLDEDARDNVSGAHDLSDDQCIGPVETVGEKSEVPGQFSAVSFAQATEVVSFRDQIPHTELDDDRGLEPPDFDFETAHVEIKHRDIRSDRDALSSQPAADNEDSGEYFDEADVQIIAVGDELRSNAVDELPPLNEPALHGTAAPQPDLATDEPDESGEYSDYRGQVNEASVSIIASHRLSAKSPA